MFRSKATTLRTLVYAKISFHEINFRGCKFCQISCRFIFADGEIIVISRRLIFVFAKYVMFINHCVKSVQIRSFFWSVFSRFWTEYGDLRSKFLYSVQKRKNTDQKNSAFGHFSCSVCLV